MKFELVPLFSGIPSLSPFFCLRFIFFMKYNKKGQTLWTSRADDWKKVWSKEFDSSLDARVMEKKIKARGAKRFLCEINVAVPPEAE